jgi:hypothetical protein
MKKENRKNKKEEKKRRMEERRGVLWWLWQVCWLWIVEFCKVDGLLGICYRPA